MSTPSDKLYDDFPNRPRKRNAPSFVFLSLLCLIAVTPLPKGSVQDWSSSFIGLFIGVCLLLWGVQAMSGRQPPRLPIRLLVLPFTLFVSVILWSFVQATPSTPVSWHHPAWEDSSQAADLIYEGSVSLDPGKTLSSAILLLAAGGVFFLFTQYCRSSRHADGALMAISLAGTLSALLGAFDQAMGFGSFRLPGTIGYEGFTGSFVNRNMFADLVVLSLLSTLALLFRFLEKHLERGQPLAHAFALFYREKPRSCAFIFVNGLALLTAFVLSGSRGGLAAGFASLVVLLITLSRFAMSSARSNRANKVLARVGIGLLFLAVVLFALFGTFLGKRLAPDEITLAERLPLYEVSLSLIPEYWLTGAGLGTFRETFYLHGDAFAEAGVVQLYTYAHNIYLGAVLQLGAPAALMLFLSIGLVFWRCFQGLQERRQHKVYPALALAAGCHVGLHGLVDSPLLMPSNAIAFAALLGVGYAQAWPSGRRAQTEGTTAQESDRNG